MAQLYIQAPAELIQFKDISPTIPWFTILSHTVTIAVTLHTGDRTYTYRTKIAARSPRETAISIAIANAAPKPITTCLLSLTTILTLGFGSVG